MIIAKNSSTTAQPSPTKIQQRDTIIDKMNSKAGLQIGLMQNLEGTPQLSDESEGELAYDKQQEYEDGLAE